LIGACLTTIVDREGNREKKDIKNAQIVNAEDAINNIMRVHKSPEVGFGYFVITKAAKGDEITRIDMGRVPTWVALIDDMLKSGEPESSGETAHISGYESQKSSRSSSEDITPAVIVTRVR
jgi:hypothetical protein